MENLEVVFNDIINDINSNNIKLETYKKYVLIKNEFDNIINKLYALIKNTDDVITCNYCFSENKMKINFSKDYTTGEYYSPKLIHNYYVNLDMETLTYKNYDWDGFVHSYNGFYDDVRKKLKNANVKLTFAGDAKKSFNNIIKVLKKSNIYKEFVNIYKYYSILNDKLKLITTKLENDANAELINNNFNIDFAKNFTNRYYLSYNNSDFKVNFVGGYSKTKMAKFIKEFVSKNPNKFYLKKVSGTIVPNLYVKID